MPAFVERGQRCDLKMKVREWETAVKMQTWFQRDATATSHVPDYLKRVQPIHARI